MDILHEKPVDRVAKRVVFNNGNHYKSNKKQNVLRWDVPPATIHNVRHDVTGYRFGYFTVVGYLGKLNPKKEGLWLCRCSCGIYEARKRKAILNPNNTNDRCEDCRNLEHIKWKSMVR